RLGVDTCLATIHAMCEVDGQWERLQVATVAVSDGDTVYHPDTVRGIREQLDTDADVDAVMPFLTYKFTAALRLLPHHTPVDIDWLRSAGGRPTTVPVPLDGVAAHERFPRDQRTIGADSVTLETRDGDQFDVPFTLIDEHGRQVAVLEDTTGRRGWVLDNRAF